MKSLSPSSNIGVRARMHDMLTMHRLDQNNELASSFYLAARLRSTFLSDRRCCEATKPEIPKQSSFS